MLPCGSVEGPSSMYLTEEIYNAVRPKEPLVAGEIRNDDVGRL